MSNVVPRGLPLTGPDYRIEIHSNSWGGRDTVVEKKGEEIRIDRPGVMDDYTLSVSPDRVLVERDSNGARLEISRPDENTLKITRSAVAFGDVTIRRDGQSIVVDREAAFKDVTYQRSENEFRIDREQAGGDVVLRHTEGGYEIDREGQVKDVTIKLSGQAAEQGLDMAVWAPRLGLEPEAYALVDKWMNEGLNPLDLITVTETGDIIAWDRSLT